MKEILVALLVLLQLALLSEGAWHKLLKPSKLSKLYLSTKSKARGLEKESSESGN
jgi:hypothetical protein